MKTNDLSKAQKEVASVIKSLRKKGARAAIVIVDFEEDESASFLMFGNRFNVLGLSEKMRYEAQKTLIPDEVNHEN